MAVTTGAMAANLAESILRLRGITGTHRIVSATASGSVVTIKLDTGESFTLTVASV
jgi:hypothetical protein